MLDKFFSLSRIRKRQYQAVENLQLQTFNAKAEDIIYLKAGMINAGINIVEAAFEADVFIASKKNSIAISADGDFYFHKNVKTFGKFSRSGVIAFEKDHILKSLKVSREQLLVLGVVSGNDYSPNMLVLESGRIMDSSRNTQVYQTTLKHVLKSILNCSSVFHLSSKRLYFLFLLFLVLRLIMLLLFSILYASMQVIKLITCG